MNTFNDNKTKLGHSYHMVTPSPYPFLMGASASITAIGATLYMHRFINGLLVLLLGIILISFICVLWWRDVLREGTFEGRHTLKVQKGLQLGFILFIVSEVMFFMGFFWAFFHNSLAPSHILGGIWPPPGIQPFSPSGIPLLNTIILLSSGVSITYAHLGLITGKIKHVILGLLITIMLAFFFTALQIFEYKNAAFSISDSIFGSVFFLLTGLHGSHVIIGTIFLIVSFILLIRHHFSIKHHIGLQSAIYYWHFVDLVWGFVYLIIYVWGTL